MGLKPIPFLPGEILEPVPLGCIPGPAVIGPAACVLVQPARSLSFDRASILHTRRWCDTVMAAAPSFPWRGPTSLEVVEGLSYFTFSCRQVSFITVDMKHEPWSVRITSAIPTQLKSCTRSLATAFEVADRSGIASGKQVA